MTLSGRHGWAVVVALLACGCHAGAMSASADAAALCPPAAPPFASPCAIPDDVTCKYVDECGAESYFACGLGTWHAVTANRPKGCPETLPAAGDVCDPCVDSDQCEYGVCGDADASVVTGCVSGRWTLYRDRCVPESGAPEDAALD